MPTFEYHEKGARPEFDNGSDNLPVSYFQGPAIDNPISMTRDGQTYYYHTDFAWFGHRIDGHRGHRRAVQSYRYDAFGSIVQQSGNIQNPFTYTGREFDPESGLYYYRARFYDAELGRFLSRDPASIFEKLQLKSANTNLYIYAANNPVCYRDPTGRKWWEWPSQKTEACCLAIYYSSVCKIINKDKWCRNYCIETGQTDNFGNPDPFCLTNCKENFEGMNDNCIKAAEYWAKCGL